MLMLQLEEDPPCGNHTDIPHSEMMALLVTVVVGRWLVVVVVVVVEEPQSVMQTTVPEGASFPMRNRVPFWGAKTTANRPSPHRGYTHQCRLRTPLEIVATNRDENTPP